MTSDVVEPMRAGALPRPRGRPRIHEPEAVRRAVEEAALAVFTANGRAGASMSAIAEQAGVSRPALYELYPSKDELYDELLGQELDRFIGAVVASYQRPATSPRSRVRTRYKAVVDYADEHPRSFAFLQRARADGSVQALRGQSTRRDVVAALTETLTAELEQIGFPVRQLPTVLAVLFLSLGEAAAWGINENPQWNPDAVIDLVTELTLAMFTRVDRSLLEAVDKPRRRR